MKKIFRSTALFLGIATIVMMLNSCGADVCIRCTQIGGTDTQEFCSPDKEDRNNFQKTWIQKGYNCEQADDITPEE